MIDKQHRKSPMQPVHQAPLPDKKLTSFLSALSQEAAVQKQEGADTEPEKCPDEPPGAATLFSFLPFSSTIYI